ncbi:MAG: toxin [Eubacterium sp.]|nr:toxin [Eubacterium sp.]
MYRDGKVYENLDKLVIDLYIDYGINSFPIKAKELCNKLGVLLIPYSSYEDEERDVLLKRSFYGFLVPPFKNKAAKIYFNDDTNMVKSVGCMRQTIFHEIKHYVCEEYYDDNPDDDDLAEHFGRYLACPTPYLVKHNITDVDEVISRFGVSKTIAENAISSAINRMQYFGQQIFDYEKPLINLLDN